MLNLFFLFTTVILGTDFEWMFYHPHRWYQSPFIALSL
ncbi:MAG: hypothetical protein OJF51_001800 [Nitrospira sp.]|nr:MAG: hypothetical protein OJF51_001800 [Nitrospira sp.]